MGGAPLGVVERALPAPALAPPELGYIEWDDLAARTNEQWDETMHKLHFLGCHESAEKLQETIPLIPNP